MISWACLSVYSATSPNAVSLPLSVVSQFAAATSIAAFPKSTLVGTVSDYQPAAATVAATSPNAVSPPLEGAVSQLADSAATSIAALNALQGAISQLAASLACTLPVQPQPSATSSITCCLLAYFCHYLAHKL